MMIGADQKKLHYDLVNVGLRAIATSAGLVQLCKELQSAGVLDDAAVGRIKHIVADEIALSAPRPLLRSDFRRDICARLDAIFSGEQKFGAAESLSIGIQHKA